MKNDIVSKQLSKYKQCTTAACNMGVDPSKQIQLFQKYGLANTCDGNEFTIFYVLIINHLIQLFISLTCVGRKMLRHDVARQQFLMVFGIVATVFLVLDGVVIGICLPMYNAQLGNSCQGIYTAWW